MELLTAAKAIELLMEVVAEFGRDYRYRVNPDKSRKCDYVRKGQPSCIVGQVAYRFGIPIETMKLWDTKNPSGTSARIAMVPYATELATDVLWTAQREQDKGHPWGEALDQAVARYDEAVLVLDTLKTY